MENNKTNIELLKIKFAFEKVKIDIEKILNENSILKNKIFILENKINENKIITKTKKSDNLTKIEGIGPKIKSTLAIFEIYTYSDLAKTSIKKLKTILEEHSLQYHDPSTWPRQARLARDNKFEELKIWQDELQGGKE